MELLLGQEELLDFGKRMHGTRISCREGRCWITQEGDSRDYILNEGSSLSVTTTGRLVVTAMGPCRILLNHSAPQGQRERKNFSRWFKEFEIVGLQAD